ncbi:MAG: hypothetical protein AAFN10_28175 [Bacteroidota bacterium]
MRQLLITLSILISLHVFGQVEVDGKLTGRHAKAVEDAKSAKQRAEQLEQQAKAKQLYQIRYDSIQNDSLAAPGVNKQDSLQVAAYILDDSSFPPEYRDLIRNPISEVQQTNQADSVALARGSSLLESEVRKQLPGELGDAEGGTVLDDPAGAVGIPSRPNPNLVKPEAARELFKKVDPEQFQNAQADIQKLKKKYSELPDTRYPEEGTKRNALEEVPWQKRIHVGGNISLQSTDPLIISTNLQLGYWINKKWLAGVGFTLREQFSERDSTSTISGDGHGYSIFTRYNIPKGFFLWGESEWQTNRSILGGEQPPNTSWERAMMLGIGREFKLGPVRMNSMILYDFNYQNNDINPRPWVFRLGFNLTKKPF